MSNINSYDGSSLDDAQTPSASDTPHLSRMACSFCRVRKLKCDKVAPACGSCTRYRHQCVYESTRKAPANRSRKKGYVSALQERLGRVMPTHVPNATLRSHTAQIETSLLNQDNRGQNELVRTEPVTRLFIGSDSEEEFVSPKIIRDLEETYFQKIHASLPMIHKARYIAATGLELGLQPPNYLRHAILALGACASQKHSGLQERFYRSAREALEFVEMNDHQLDSISLEQAQTWILIAAFEFRRTHFHRSWLSTGRAVRLAQMMGLHRMDRKESGSQPTLLPKPKDWTAGEERRRTFWLAFCLDSYAAIGHGWPMTVNDKDIITRLPSPEEAFQNSTEATALFLHEACTPDGAATLTPFPGVVAMTAIYSRRLTNLRRSNPASHREFWQSGSLDLTPLRPFPIPDHLKLPSPKWDSNLYFLNMIVHASTIRIHQEVFAKTGVDSLHTDRLRDTELIQLESAIEIASVMRASCHVDLSAINPFTSFCLYVAAIALARTKTIQLDENQKNSLQFLLTAMNYLGEVNPLTTAFLRDLEEEFPDLTSSFSSLDVDTQVKREAAPPATMSFSPNFNQETPREPDASTESSIGTPFDLNDASATRHTVSSREWAMPDGLQLNFDDDAYAFHDNNPDSRI